MSESVTTPSPEASADPAQIVFQLATGYILSSALHAAVSLGVADHLDGGPRTSAELARATGANEDSLHRVLRALASAGVFEEVEPRKFALTPAAALLRANAPERLYELARWMCDPFHFRVYADALHSVKTGRPAIEKTHGAPVFEHFARDPELSNVFNEAMTAFSAAVIPAVLKVYDFSGVGTLVDVAGGQGAILTSILRAYPAMRGILFDLDHVLAGAEERFAAMGLAGRCRAEAGDFFRAVPAGGDAYIMKHIIHDWDDERALVILKNVRSALGAAPRGRLILLESVLRPGNEPDFGKIIDLEMLLLPGGRERTAEEFGALFSGAGFELTRVLPTESPLCVIEGRPA
jgi:hypothetical protein